MRDASEPIADVEPLHAVPGDGERYEPPGFEELYASHFGFTWRIVGHLGVPEAALDDVVQDVWVVVHRRLPSFEGRSSLKTWLFGIAHNVVRNQRRAEERRAKLDIAAEPAAASPDPEVIRAGNEAWELVQCFLNTLDAERRALFVCSLLEHLSARETAEATGVDVATVYKRSRSLRLAFQNWLLARESDAGSGAT